MAVEVDLAAPGGGSIYDLLNDDKVKQEVELLDAQEQDIQALQEDARERMQNMFQEMRESGAALKVCEKK
ncbi:MAG: hypothetical protein R3C28_20680 [Pirellulaceae bacterium]